MLGFSITTLWSHGARIQYYPQLVCGTACIESHLAFYGRPYTPGRSPNQTPLILKKKGFYRCVCSTKHDIGSETQADYRMWETAVPTAATVTRLHAPEELVCTLFQRTPRREQSNCRHWKRNEVHNTKVSPIRIADIANAAGPRPAFQEQSPMHTSLVILLDSRLHRVVLQSSGL